MTNYVPLFVRFLVSLFDSPGRSSVRLFKCRDWVDSASSHITLVIIADFFFFLFTGFLSTTSGSRKSVTSECK